QNPKTNEIARRELGEHYRTIGQWSFQDRRLVIHVRAPDPDGLSPACDLRSGPDTTAAPG
ncbi:MAG: hypothetical protein AB7F98_18655, partial [Novosphingobium sp.]